MTTYRLPEVLGGSEVEIVTPAWAGNAIVCEVALVADPSVKVSLARALLVGVEPPLPPEPPVGSFVHLKSYYGVYERVERGWLASSDVGGRAFDWDTLLRLNSGDAPVILAPDPFAEPVQLPWSVKFVDSDPIMVAHSTASNRAAYVSGWGHLEAAQARDMARALWALADEDERAS